MSPPIISIGDNVQARLFTPGDFNAYTVNGGGADVDGVEISLTLRPTRNLTFASNISYNDARLSQLLPDSFAPGGGYAKGTRLPGASDWILANSIDLNFPDSPMKPRVGIAHRYLSAAPVAFGATLEKGDFHIVDLNAAFTVAGSDRTGIVRQESVQPVRHPQRPLLVRRIGHPPAHDRRELEI
jgi:iron complex outermembrane receptor protein